MRALISPKQIVFNASNEILGYLVVQVENVDFDVASPLFWVNCPENCIAGGWYYFEGNVYPINIEKPVEETVLLSDDLQ